MTQRFSFWEDLSIEENLDFVARMYGVKNRRQTVQESVEELGLAERRKQLAGELSGGWKQRLALAACLIHRPQLLLLDEPTAGVDPKARREFWEEIHRLADQGLTFLITTHYMDEAERCHRLAYIAAGRMLAHGTVAEVVEQDRLTFGMMIGIPLLQLVLFGYAINSDPKRLPTAVLLADDGPHGRAILYAIKNSGYFEFVREVPTEAAADGALARGDVLFVVSV